MPTELSIGISDLIADRDCPRKAAYGLRRHTGVGTQDHASRTPESQHPGAAYGSCLHDVVEMVEDGFSDQIAIETAWAKWGGVLAPEDLAQLTEDLVIYRTRDPQNVRTILNEGELKVYLCDLDDGTPVYFRGRIDRLYERIDSPGQWIHIDYKTSKWRKDKEEVDGDLQLWSYNWLIHEYFPECESLHQVYDQLKYGQETTGKSPAKRDEIREWLIVAARNFFQPRELRADGLPAPKFNTWCPYCPLIMDCPIIPQLSSWAISKIKLMGAELPEGIPVTPMDEQLEPFSDVQTAVKTLQAWEKRVKELVRSLPASERDRLGFKTYQRNATVFDAGTTELLYRELGPAVFFSAIKVTQKGLEEIGDETLREWALSLGEKVPGATVVSKRK